jgi:hypothetical protein
VTHPVSISTRGAVTLIGPLLQRLSGQMGDTPGAGMELICRVMYDMQQDYFQWLSMTAAGINVPAPSYSRVTLLVQSHRAQSLATLPTHWYDIVDCPRVSAASRSISAPTLAPPSMRTPSTSATATNAHADKRLLDRYKASGHANITALLGGRDLEIPKHAGKAVCLAWALKGACSNSCKRADLHVRYGRGVNQELHALLDKCGVANPQP